MKVLVTGASGFVGNHVIEKLLAEGHEVIGVSRTAPSGNRRIDGAIYSPGIDFTLPATVKQSDFADVDTVVHLVGIIMERRPQQTFQKVHVEGTRNVVAAAKAAGVKRFIYLSAIGSNLNAESEYSRTKAQAEEIVKDSGIPFVILRPSIILGKDGEFVEQMKDLVLHGGLPVNLPFPVVPVPGSGENKFQPIYIDDLTSCIAKSLVDDELTDQTIEIGGDMQVTFNKLLNTFQKHLHTSKPLLHAPIALLALVAPLVEMTPKPPFSGDQLKNLKHDNITDIKPMVDAFGFEPIGFEDALDKIYSKA